MPTISVLIPYYNDARFLRTAIDSVFASTLQDFELVLLNHASTDESRQIAHSYNDPRVKHIDMPKNIGAGGGLLVREMVHMASGKYAKFFCADDQLLPTGLQDLVDYMESHPEKGFAFGDVQYIDINGRKFGSTFFQSRIGFAGERDEASCLRRFYHGTSFLPFIGSIIRREILSDLNFDATMIMLADVFIWSTLLLQGAKIGFLDRCVANYRVHDGQMSSVATSDKAIKRSHYEVLAMRQYLMRNIGMDLVSQILPDDVCSRRVKTDDDARFVLAVDYLKRENDEAAYLELNSMLQDDALRAHFEVDFGFDVGQFRTLYTNAYVKDDSLKGCIRRIKQILGGALGNFPTWIVSKIARMRKKTM